MNRTRRVLAVACCVVLGGATIGAGFFRGMALAQSAAAAPDKTATEPASPNADSDKPKADPDAAALAADEAAVTIHIKALGDADGAKRAAAAEALKRIVDRYPSGTVYLRTPDGGEAEWRKKIAEITPDMSLGEVRKISPRWPEASDEILTRNGDPFYRLDYHWMVNLVGDQSGESKKPAAKSGIRPELTRRTFEVDVAPPKDFTGTWTTWYVNGQKATEIGYRNGKWDGTSTHWYASEIKSSE